MLNKLFANFDKLAKVNIRICLTYVLHYFTQELFNFQHFYGNFLYERYFS